MTVIIGNIFSLIACIIMVISGYAKSKKRTILGQTIQIPFDVAACVMLGAVSGAIICALAIPRNILAYKDKMGLGAKLILLIVTLPLSYMFNTKGWIGLLPIVATTIYIVFMGENGDTKYKIVAIISTAFWCAHDFLVQGYVAAIFDFGTIITSFIAIYRIQKDKNNNKIESEQA